MMPAEMAPLLSRLSRTEFLRVFKRGRRIPSASFQMIAAPASALYVAVVVSKKVARTAVVRNKVKRRLYHAFLDGARRVGMPGAACVLLVRPDVLAMPSAALADECAEALRHAFGSRGTSR